MKGAERRKLPERRTVSAGTIGPGDRRMEDRRKQDIPHLRPRVDDLREATRTYIERRRQA